MASKGGKPGAPAKFKREFIETAKKLARFGFIDREVAEFFEVSVRALHKWKLQYPEFSESLRLGKDEADECVKRALFGNAVGHVGPDAKYYKPDTTACIFWMKNRRPDEWREKFEHDHGLGASREKLQELLRAVEERIGNLEGTPQGIDREPRRTQ